MMKYDLLIHSKASQSRRLIYKAFNQQHFSSTPYVTHKKNISSNITNEIRPTGLMLTC